MEQNDLKLLNEAFFAEKKKEVIPVYIPPKPVQKPNAVKGPHHGGPFITGDFQTETVAASNQLRR
jgi:hypothetical protein